MSYGETLARCDTLAFVTALALVADGKRRARRCVTIAEIQARVCERFNLSPADMRSPSRLRRVARPRQIGMYLARNIAGRSWGFIGREFGKHHTTAIEGVRQVERLCAADPEFAATVRKLEQDLNGLPR